MKPHTPGPWHVAGAEHQGRKLVCHGDEATVYPIVAEVNGEANACLIAAAPKLLKALDHLLEQTVDMDLRHGITLSEGEEEARKEALEAIAEATGEAA